MGYRRSEHRPKLRVTFEGFDQGLDQLQLTCEPLSIGEFVRLQELLAEPILFGDPHHQDRLAELLDLFEQSVTWWNVEDDEGRPVEPTAAYLMGEDGGFVTAVVEGWQRALTRVPRPLRKPLPDGEQAEPGQLTPSVAETLAHLPSTPIPQAS